MLELVRPRAFVPVHGTLHHLTRHAELARELGVPERDACSRTATSATLDDRGFARPGASQAGRVHVFARRALARAASSRERAALASHGAAHVVVPVDARGRLAGEIALGDARRARRGARRDLLASARNAGARSARGAARPAAPTDGRVDDDADLRGRATGGAAARSRACSASSR